ncbi:uncharacterized protein AMSG_09732 [Thecamonas trahens ATCC 50062]|uniref:Uncharacterized protein n=1 Tax=Thecamonas trahens ATCC 50062 TaxID=461836 RepID=A0A0L0DP50_THETB|nr:hypothetical protein AMSG_09732 [Thecamonas trahens ATCC 50062]KNC54067.1 hypothetical protein AMSG_09732 [Thecamonas trahens ATCC 50062]|eukprot:XP_013754076.1 hypothetical protein AMSG_09732 [Thecamonas trahens ATCC 50062]
MTLGSGLGLASGSALGLGPGAAGAGSAAGMGTAAGGSAGHFSTAGNMYGSEIQTPRIGERLPRHTPVSVDPLGEPIDMITEPGAAAASTAFTFVQSDDGPLLASSLSLADMLSEDYGVSGWPKPDPAMDVSDNLDLGMVLPSSPAGSFLGIDYSPSRLARTTATSHLDLQLADILPPLDFSGALAPQAHHDSTLYSRAQYNDDVFAARAPFPASLARSAQPAFARAIDADTPGFGAAAPGTTGQPYPEAKDTISPARLAAELGAMDISTETPSNAGWTIPLFLPLGNDPASGPLDGGPLSLPPRVASPLSSLATAATLSPRPPSSAAPHEHVADSPLPPLGPPSGGSSGSRPLPRETRRGNQSYLVTQYGEFPIDDDILIWEREIGLISVYANGTVRHISDEERASRPELKYVRCHYCVNGSNPKQKRSKWITKCRHVGCRVFYCQTHYPMFSRVRVVKPAGRKPTSAYEGFLALKNFEHTPFVCLYDFGECCCSESNSKCSDVTSKQCKTFGQASHRCEKQRNLVWNMTVRKRNKSKKATSKAAKSGGSSAAASASSSSASYRKRGTEPPSEDGRKAKKQRNL